MEYYYNFFELAFSLGVPTIWCPWLILPAVGYSNLLFSRQVIGVLVSTTLGLSRRSLQPKTHSQTNLQPARYRYPVGA